MKDTSHVGPCEGIEVETGDPVKSTSRVITPFLENHHAICTSKYGALREKHRAERIFHIGQTVPEISMKNRSHYILYKPLFLRSYFTVLARCGNS